MYASVHIQLPEGLNYKSVRQVNIANAKFRTCPFQNIEFEMSISFLQFWEPTGQSSVTVFYDFSATDRKNDFHKNTFLRPGVNFEISGVLFITFC